MSEIMTVARPYAKAVFESALEKNRLEPWLVAIKNLALIANCPEMESVITNPLITKKKLVDLFVDVAGKSLEQADELKELVKLLAESKRLTLLPAIAEVYEQFILDYEKKIEVKVVSAYPIDDARMQRLARALQNSLKRQVTLECSIDRTLLGGVIVYAGDQVIDGSLRSKLKRLAERLCS